MLCKRIASFQIQNNVSYRSISNTYQNFKKLRAFPFEISPAEAIRQLSPIGSIYAGKGVLPSFANALFPSAGFTPIQPTRIIPVYFPAWVYDGEISCDVRRKGQKDGLVFTFSDIQLPGNDYNALSTLSFTGNFWKVVPFTDELERQHGMDITCLPYTISPFSFLDIATKISGDIQLTQDLTFRPSTIRFDLIAAYPILIPFYIAEYPNKLTSKDQGNSVILVKEGLQETAMMVEYMASHLLPGISPTMARRLTDFLSMQDMFKADGLKGTIGKWLGNLRASPDTIEKLAAASQEVVSDDDPRIRELNESEKVPVLEWISGYVELMKNVENITILRTMDPQLLVPNKSFSPEELRNLIENAEEEIKAKVKDLNKERLAIKAMRDETKPGWWKEYEQQATTSSTKNIS